MEVDAYCFSTIAGYCTEGLANKVTYNPADKKPFAALNAAFLYQANHEVKEEDQLIFAAPSFVNDLRETKEEGAITKFLGQSDLGEGKDVNFTVTKYMGRKLVEVAPARFRTNILLGAEGYGWGEGSEAIAFMLVSKSAVMHVVKYEKVKVIGDDLNLAGNGFDGYTVYARIYHDVFVPDNKRVAVYTATYADVDAPAPTFDIMFKAGKIASITTLPGDVLAYVATSSATETVGEASTGTLTIAKVGDAKVAGKYYLINLAGKVLAEKTIA